MSKNGLQEEARLVRARKLSPTRWASLANSELGQTKLLFYWLEKTKPNLARLTRLNFNFIWQFESDPLGIRAGLDYSFIDLIKIEPNLA